MVTKKNNRGGFAAVTDATFAEHNKARMATCPSLELLTDQPSTPRILVGDCIAAMGRQVERGSIDLVITSPPYLNIGMAYGDHFESVDAYVEFTRSYIAAAAETLSPHGAMWVNVGHHKASERSRIPLTYYLWPVFRDCGLTMIQEVIWDRQRHLNTATRFSTKSERWVWLVKDPTNYVFNLDPVRQPLKQTGDKRCNPAGANPSDIWSFLPVQGAKKLGHDCPYPQPMIERIVLACSNAGDTVLDPFGGSGTTGAAALAHGRKAVLIERDPKSLKIMSERWVTGVIFDYDLPVPAPDIVDEIIAAKRAAYWAAQREQDPAIRYATLCSGVEAVSLAWEGLGYKAEFFSETGKFQSAFLAHRYPTVPNVGDMTLIDGRAYAGKLDVLWASTPCQTFSRDGDGAALRDPRGALTLTAVKLADEINPPVFILENVPDFLNIENGEVFGQVLAALVGEDVPLVPAGRRWPNAGAVCGPRRNIAWRILDAQYSGLAQRRERVFIVACPVGGADPTGILLEQGGHGNADALLRAIEAEEAASRAVGRSVIWFNGDRTPKWNDRIAYTLKANGGFGNLSGVMVDGDVRRLTPEEREALMGMPRGYTDVAGASDAKRNEAIGNSLAVPDVRWLGERVKAALAKPVHSDNVVTLTRSCRTKPPKPDIIIDDLCDYLIAA